MYYHDLTKQNYGVELEGGDKRRREQGEGWSGGNGREGKGGLGRRRMVGGAADDEEQRREQQELETGRGRLLRGHVTNMEIGGMTCVKCFGIRMEPMMMVCEVHGVRRRPAGTEAATGTAASLHASDPSAAGQM